MSKKTTIIIICVVAAAVVAAGLGVLIWWLVAGRADFSIVELEGDGFRDVQQTAAFTRIRGVGDMFWWFYPAAVAGAASRPIILWLDGVTGLPPSLLANFGMFGPLDFNLNRRTDSWIEEFNLLFVDAPLGTGFSTASADSNIPSNGDENADHVMFTLESFYSLHEEFENAPLYIFGQGDGSQLALSLAIKITESERFKSNLQRVALGNGIVSPAVVLTKLGFYLEEMGYIDARGRAAIENFSNETNTLIDEKKLEEAFDKFISLGEFVNEEAGAVAVNLGQIVEKLNQESTPGKDYFGQRNYLRSALRTDIDFYKFMEETVAPAVGISSATSYDYQREAALQACKGSFMISIIDKVEHILRETNLTVTIYNGNLDAVSNTPGQLDWVNSIVWSGQDEFLNSSRNPLVVNGQIQGYFKETNRLQFYWINAAGQSVPIDNPLAIRRALQRITSN